MNVQTVCLALLAHGEASGYDLKTRWTDGPFSHFVDASFGSIYPALARLEQDGLVSVRSETQPGKPARKIYALTDTGRSAFASALATPPAPDVYRSAFALIALCAPFLSRDVIQQALEARVAQQRAEIAQLEVAKAHSGYKPISWLIDWGLTHFASDLAHIEARGKDLVALAGSGRAGEQPDVLPPRASQAGK
jgi:DNA-binding PadR family transcriptional regulator